METFLLLWISDPFPPMTIDKEFSRIESNKDTDNSSKLIRTLDRPHWTFVFLHNGAAYVTHTQNQWLKSFFLRCGLFLYVCVITNQKQSE